MANSTLHPESLGDNGSAALEKGTTGPAEQKLVEPKEGGLKAWLTVAGSSAALFVSFGWVNCIGLFQAEYEANQLKDYTSSEVSWIASMECMPSLFSFL